MGCSCSHKLEDDSSPKKNNLRIEESQVESIDELYEEAAEVLLLIKAEYRAIAESKIALYMYTGADQIKSHKLKDAILAILWAFSALTNGRLKQIGFQTIKQPPYFVVDEELLTAEHLALVSAWKQVVNSLELGMGEFNNLQEKLHLVTANSDYIRETAKGILLKKSVSPEKRARVEAIINNNTTTIAVLPKYAQRLQSYCTKTTSKISNFMENELGGLMEAIEEVGRENFNANIFDPKVIVLNS